jgi:phospholipid/cholesterol/gamma-HCH transport system substrate-binding protein
LFMSKSRLEWKVGLFVFIGLVLLAGLLIQFSKGLTFSRTYDILLRSENVSGLKTRAGVLMSGVQVGTVSGIQLDPDGKRVTITLRIQSQYKIHNDALFSIEQSGFLGDQYVGIMPTKNEGALFRNGDGATAAEPFNLQSAARTTLGFINRLDETAKKLDDAIVEVRRLLLNQATLTNLAVSAANLRAASDRAVTTIDRINALVDTNAPALAQSGTNLVAASEQLTLFASALHEVLATNGPGIQASVKNIESSTTVLKNLMDDVQAGKGLAGTLMRNEQIGADLSQVVNNLSITTSNLNRNGLWGILWRQKQPQTSAPPAGTLSAPKNRDL